MNSWILGLGDFDLIIIRQCPCNILHRKNNFPLTHSTKLKIIMENLLHSLPDGNSKWRPTSQPQRVDPEDSCPDPEDLSFDSSCDSINEENVSINSISTMALESTIIQRSIHIQRNIRGKKALNILSQVISFVVFKAKIEKIKLTSQIFMKLRKSLASFKICKFFRKIRESKQKLRQRNEILLRVKINAAQRKIVKGFRMFLKKKIVQRKVEIVRQTAGVCRIAACLILHLERRRRVLMRIRENICARVVVKVVRMYGIRRMERLRRVRENAAARVVTRFIRSFICQKKVFSEQLLEKYRNHCAIIIQKHMRGFIVYKSFQLFLKCRQERIKALILGCKTRRILKSIDFHYLKIRARNDVSFRQEFIEKFNAYLGGSWIIKFKVPAHRRILYKNSTKQLRVAHERKLSNQSLDDSVQKVKEVKKNVRFSLKNHESPKLNEPDLKATAKKSILRTKGNPENIDWPGLQEKLDKIFFESEGRYSIDETSADGGKRHSLLFKTRPRMKKKQKRLEMKDWNVDDFEVSCEEDSSSIKEYQFLTNDKIPVLSSDSKFWIDIEVNSLYKALKQQYNLLKVMNQTEGL